MQLCELIQRFRQDADDEIHAVGATGDGDARFGEQWITDRLNDAIDEACIRSRLIHESSREDVCRIQLEPEQATYRLHKTLYELDHLGVVEPGSCRPRQPVYLASTGYLDDTCPNWRDLPPGTPRFAIQDDTNLRLVPAPLMPNTVLMLEGYRLPLKPLSQKTDEPEINRIHHRQLVQWVLWCAFSQPDVDHYDLDRAMKAMNEFTAYFGERPDVDLRRTTRHDVPHTVKGYWV